MIIPFVILKLRPASHLMNELWLLWSALKTIQREGFWREMSHFFSEAKSQLIVQDSVPGWKRSSKVFILEWWHATLYSDRCRCPSVFLCSVAGSVPAGLYCCTADYPGQTAGCCSNFTEAHGSLSVWTARALHLLADLFSWFSVCSLCDSLLSVPSILVLMQNHLYMKKTHLVHRKMSYVFFPEKMPLKYVASVCNCRLTAFCG